jgi:hypothetical protein
LDLVDRAGDTLVWQATYRGVFSKETLKEMQQAEEEHQEKRVRALATDMGAITEDD